MAGRFSVALWLESLGMEEFTTQFQRHGLVSFKRVSELTRSRIYEECKFIKDDGYVWRLGKATRELRAKTEEEVVKELTVSDPIHEHTG